MKELVDEIEKSLDNSTTMRHISLRSIRQYASLLIRLGRAKLVSTTFGFIIIVWNIDFCCGMCKSMILKGASGSKISILSLGL